MAEQLGIDWDAQPLGTQRDAELARALGVSKYVVWRERKKRGIAKVRRVDWDSVPLGEVSDVIIAERLKVDPTSVGAQRRRRRIRSHREIDWDAQPYATKSDVEIATSLGVTPRTVGIQRRARRILRRRESDASFEVNARCAARRRHLSSLGSAIDWDTQPLGKVSDVALASSCGISAHAVRRQRVKRGIASAPRETVRQHVVGRQGPSLAR